MKIIKELPELVRENVISQELADNIQEYYRNKKGTSSKLLLVVFSILGAILVGLGIIQIIAHNWDDFSINTKVIFSFLPLVASQILAAFALIKKYESKAWLESTAILLVFSIGACISLISQTYHIYGDLAKFILVWSLLSLPIAYIFRSSVTSLLYIIAISSYGVAKGYSMNTSIESYYYWLLLAGIIPYYFKLMKTNSKSVATQFHNWFIPISLIIGFGTLVDRSVDVEQEGFAILGYFGLHFLLYFIGSLKQYNQEKLIYNGFKFLGSLGTIFLLFTNSSDYNWHRTNYLSADVANITQTPIYYISIFIIILGTVVLYLNKSKIISKFDPMNFVFIAFGFAFLVSPFVNLAIVLVNVYIFLLGVYYIKEGTKLDHLGTLNKGLAIISLLTLARFLDTDLDYIIKGIIFVFVGILFFVANLVIIRKRKVNEK